MIDALNKIARDGVTVNVTVEPKTVVLFGTAVFAAVVVANLVTRR